MEHHALNVTVGFATCGRAEVLREAVELLQRQTMAPQNIVICYTKPSDITGISPSAGMVLLQSEAGLPRQRNVILDHAGDNDLLLFLDDDFFVTASYVEIVAKVMARHPEIVGVTGTPLADDVKGPGIAVDAALRMVKAWGRPEDFGFDPAPHCYGCNMALRLATVRAHGLRFDERLPLYGWSEDVDFTHRLKRHGQLAKLRGARGVHLGVKNARSSGRRLGYSQVANPLYLLRKGSYDWRRASGSVGRNLAMNALRSAWPEPWVDRRGRLQGNLLAFLDLLRGRMRPERVLEI